MKAIMISIQPQFVEKILTKSEIRLIKNALRCYYDFLAQSKDNVSNINKLEEIMIIYSKL